MRRVKSCLSCKGTKFKRKKVEFVTKVGEHEVIHSPEEDVCVWCGKWELHSVIHAAFVLTSVSKILREQELNGAIIKDVCRLIGTTRSVLAARLGVAEDVVVGWEEGATFERWLPLALAGLVHHAMQQGLGLPVRDG